MLDLDKRSITYLPGVGPKKADILQKEAGISSYEDLLFYFPYKYIDRSRFYKVAEISGNMPYIQLKGSLLQTMQMLLLIVGGIEGVVGLFALEDKLLVLVLLAFTALLSHLYAPFKLRRLVDEML